MNRDPRLYLRDIAESIQDIENYTREMNEEGFRASRLVQDAVVRRLEIIGEAARQLPASIKNQYPSVPWRQISGLRNRITHEYFGILLDRIWTVVQRDLPVLRDAVRRIQQELGSSPDQSTSAR